MYDLVEFEGNDSVCRLEEEAEKLDILYGYNTPFF